MSRLRWPAAGAGILVLVTCGAAVLGGLAGCEPEEEEFPDQIPEITSTVGEFYLGLLARDRARCDSVVSDPVLYDDLVHVLGSDSLAIRSRRIYNPIDSAHVVMTVDAVDPVGGEIHGTYQLDLHLGRRGERFWINGHRLSHSRP